MANITIPNLPSATAATDLDILVIVDSGETTTSKITKADLLSGIGGGNLVDGVGTNSLSTINSESNATGEYSIFIAPNDTTNTGVSSGYKSLVISPVGNGEATSFYSMNISNDGGTAAGNRSSIMGGNSNLVYGTYSHIHGSFTSQISSGADYSSVFGGAFSNINSNIDYSSIYNGRNNTIGSDNNKPHQLILGGRLCQIGYSQDEHNTLINSYDCSLLKGKFTLLSNSNNYDHQGANSYPSIGMGNNNSGFYVGNSVNSSAMIGGLGSWLSTNVGKNVSIFASTGANITKDGGGYANTGNDSRFENVGIYNSTNSKIINPDDTTAISNIGIFSSNDVIFSGVSNVAAIAVSNYTGTTDNVVVVPQLVMTEYSSLNFSGDTAAAAGGVVLGGIYHDNGALRVRIS